MKYTVKAYLGYDFKGLMDSLETDSFYKAEDFVWANCQHGYNCKLTNTETGGELLAYAEDFDDVTEEIPWHKTEIDALMEDLALEQREQM